MRVDLLAGFTGALIVLPQGVAFATIAGLPPQYGLYAAMIPAVIAALFGSSWHLVSGPTTAISIAVYASLSHQADPGSAQYISLVLTLTFLVGVFQLMLGLARMGALVNFISHTVVIGFTAGAAILIGASQVRNFFGIDIARGTPFYEIVRQLVLQAGNINPWVTGIGAATLATGILSRRYFKKIPYMITAMIAGSILAAMLNWWLGQEATGISTVGALPAQLPPLSLPDFSLGRAAGVPFSFDANTSILHDSLDALWPLIMPMTVAGVPMGILFGIGFYFPVRAMVERYQARRRTILSSRANGGERS